MCNVPILLLWLLARLIRRHGIRLLRFFQPSLCAAFRVRIIRAASTSLP